MKKYGLMAFFLLFLFQSSFAHTNHSTKNNYTGDWEIPTSWNPIWNSPLTNIVASNININGNISCNNSLTFSSVGDTLRVIDTLVIFGDLRLGNSTSLHVKEHGILIVRGNLNTVNISKIQIDANAFLVVTGNFNNQGSITNGAFVSSNSPTNLFIGGSITPAGMDPILYPVFNCPGSSPYANSNCSYGNMVDVLSSSIGSFFQSTCKPTIANAGQDQTGATMCGLTTTTLAGNTPLVGTGLWSILSGIGGTITNPTNPTSTFSGTIGTTYQLRWTITDSPCSTSDEVTIAFNSIPTPIITIVDNSGIASNDGVICEGATATLTALGGSTYSWSSGETTPAITKGIAGTYMVTVTNANGCHSNKVASITVNPVPVPYIDITDNSGITLNDGIICQGATATLTASGGTTYSWSSGETTPVITKGIAGTYMVTVTDANGCQNLKDASITVNPLPVPLINITENSGIASNDGIICQGATATLTASGGSTYSWSSGETTAEITKGIAGTYMVTATDANGCQNLKDTSITVNPSPVPLINITENSGIASNDGIICEGATATLTASGGSTYSWSSGETTAAITKGIAGTYMVTVTDANGCQNLKDTSITVNPSPVPLINITENSGITSNDGVICEGATATLTASGGSTYSWSSGETTAEITKDKAGIYVVTATDAQGCNNTANKSITITAKPEVNAGIDGEVCGQIYTLNATTNSETGTWSVTSGEPNVAFTPNENDPAATVKISNYSSYQFTWTSLIQNCPASSSVTVIFHEIPVANAGIDQKLNNAFTTNMKAELPPLETGEWSLLEGSGIIDDINSPVTRVLDLSAGENIFLWSVHSEFCSSSDSVTIKVDDLFVPQVITPNGDLKNDFFVIDDIEKNGPAELVISDRWGNEVYSNSNYLNNWEGKSNNGRTLSNDTYFYFLKFANGKRTKGFVVIKR